MVNSILSMEFVDGKIITKIEKKHNINLISNQLEKDGFSLKKNYQMF